ncbi:alpha-L-fucosidase [Sphingobacterium sp. SGG-5]|uniref:alpha-L-fucosidase n=1 Tax=Sphingobacterium sp. SGG-5 TaxID=2710881 RepID=UPI0013E9CD18|nr:alpha-L-fucosidase [Sphingobacterium sp. SGG-5]NGM61898.1 alpha-L-fucosidase [Sphingobacterium sp. SGG-5]
MKKLIILLVACSVFSSLHAQKYQPTSENLANRQWFEDAKFGVFIHWGVYSILGDGEWVMNQQKFALHEYELLPKFFNPIDFDAKEWARLFKSAGAHYVTFTSRHHDGFSMWDSNASAYNIVQATPFKRDIVKELAEACRVEGLKIMFYYSLLDWHRDDYLPAGRTGREIADRDSTKGNWNSYIRFMKAQLTELLTNYGRIDGIWFDGDWDKPKADWRYEEIYSLIHRLQPQCLVGNNHHKAPIDGEDFQMFERDLPGHNTTGFGTKAEDVGKLPKEVCGTIGGSWGFNIKDRKQKSFQEVLAYLVKASGYGANLLLNVGPMPNGEIQDYQQDRLRELGQWLTKYGDAIYGTEGGFIPPNDDYALTKKGKEIYLHILNTSNTEIEVDNFDVPIQSITTFGTKDKVSYTRKDSVLKVNLPKSGAEIEPYVLTIKI